MNDKEIDRELSAALRDLSPEELTEIDQLVNRPNLNPYQKSRLNLFLRFKRRTIEVAYGLCKPGEARKNAIARLEEAFFWLMLSINRED
jgi:hypothetical protein